MRSPSFDSLLLPLTVGAVFAVALLVALVRSPAIPSWAHVSPEQIAEAKKHGVPVAFENEFGMRFVLIPAGMFLMGSPQEEDGRRDDEAQREVTLTKPFYMQITELTNAQYRAWMPKHSSGKYGEYPLDADTQPAVFVSWHDATTFAMWLSSANGSRRYRLPTEAEWEYTCQRARRPAITSETR